MRPILEYGSSVWEPHYEGLIDDLEKVQKRAARFVTRNYTYEKGSMTDILKKLKWESLQKRRKDNRIILLYKGLKGRAKIPTDDLIPKNRRCRNQHSLAFQIPSASTNAYLHSFFPQTIRDWNELPDSLISSAELSDDCVSKFTTLVRNIGQNIPWTKHPRCFLARVDKISHLYLPGWTYIFIFIGVDKTSQQGMTG